MMLAEVTLADLELRRLGQIFFTRGVFLHNAAYYLQVIRFKHSSVSMTMLKNCN